MNYQIDLMTSAKAEVRKLPGHIRAQANQLFDVLAIDPYPPRAKELRGKPGIYRIWLAAHWRVVYAIDDEMRIVTILRVRRKEYIDYEGL